MLMRHSEIVHYIATWNTVSLCFRALLSHIWFQNKFFSSPLEDNSCGVCCFAVSFCCFLFVDVILNGDVKLWEIVT